MQSSVSDTFARDVSRPSVSFSKWRQIHLKDYAIRFVFGGVVSVLAALIAQWTTERFGGIFTAFPAICLASLTLIGKKDGAERSAQDAEGAAAGGVALAITAAFIALTVVRIPGIASLLAALLLWLAVAVALYGLLVKIGWLRTYEREQGGENNDQQHDTGSQHEAADDPSRRPAS